MRPEYLIPAAAALGLALLLLLAQRWPLTSFFAPAFVLACRYYELARFEPVRRSRLLFLLVLTCTGTTALWALTHRSPGLAQPLTLALVVGMLAVSLHLFTTQRRLARAQISRSLLHLADEDAPYWVCGGPLAILPVVLLMGCLSGLMWWRSPLLLLWGLAAVPVLAAQLRGHAWFPRLGAAWLAAWVGIELLGVFGNGGEASDDASVSFTVVAVIVAMGIYLLYGQRVRRTFLRPAAEAAEPQPVLPPADADLRAPVPLRSVRHTG